MGVLGEQHRVEAALGGRAGEVGDRQGLVGREVVQAVTRPWRRSAHETPCRCHPDAALSICDTAGPSTTVY